MRRIHLHYRNRNFWKRGTLTVEASVVVPAVCVITAALLMLLFFEHNRVWYLSASAEAAVCAINCDSSGCSVSVEGQRFPVWGERFLWDVQMRIRKNYPVRTLRQIRGVRALGKEQTYGGNTNRIPQGSSS